MCVGGEGAGNEAGLGGIQMCVCVCVYMYACVCGCVCVYVCVFAPVRNMDDDGDFVCSFCSRARREKAWELIQAQMDLMDEVAGPEEVVEP